METPGLGMSGAACRELPAAPRDVHAGVDVLRRMEGYGTSWVPVIYLGTSLCASITCCLQQGRACKNTTLPAV